MGRLETTSPNASCCQRVQRLLRVPSDFKNVSVPTHSGYERIVAVRPEGFSEAFQLVVGERLFGKIKNLIAQPQSTDLLSVRLA